MENRLLFDEGISANKPIEEQLMNLDLKKAYEVGIDMAGKHHTYDIEMLSGLSALVMANTGSDHNTIAGSFSSAKGELSLLNVSAGRGGKSYIAWQKVPAKLKEFCKRLNTQRSTMGFSNINEKYKLSFLAHYFLVTIHPWADGNGRMSRLVMNMIQHEFDVVPSMVRSKKQSRIYRKSSQFSRKG